jgi:hypothetical protein
VAAKRKDPLEAAREVLAKNRGYALGFLQQAGEQRTRELLKAAHDDLAKRLKAAEGPKGPGKESFTAAQLRSTLAQVQAVTKDLQKGLKKQLVAGAPEAAQAGAEGAARYMMAADKAFRGVGTQPLALRTAAMLEAARGGSSGSVLRRILGDELHPGRPGVLQRYGAATILHFERELQKGVLARKPRAEVMDDLVEASPFLQGAPRYWAERIARTELHAAMNKGQLDGMRQAHEQLGDMVKILSAVFDDRTGSDSFAVHGQIRRLEEPFEWWEGAYMHPPNRPNDREVVVPHRLAWPIPPYLAWRDAGQIAARWQAEGRKGKPPERPLMTTIPLSKFGGGAPQEAEGSPESSGDE